jgi:hypothetical protein
MNPLDSDALLLLAILAAGCAVWLAHRIAAWLSS